MESFFHFNSSKNEIYSIYIKKASIYTHKCTKKIKICNIL